MKIRKILVKIKADFDSDEKLDGIKKGFSKWAEIDPKCVYVAFSAEFEYTDIVLIYE